MNLNPIESFSVYNIGSVADTDHPLAFLEGNKDVGWHVARNLLKPLNHLGFLNEKESIAQELNLHNLLTEPGVFKFNYEMLEAHQAKKVATDQVIRILAEQQTESSIDLRIEKVRQRLKSFSSVRHMEFHPSDVCNLTCKDCTYGHDEEETKPLPVNFDFNAIHKIASLRPDSMVVIGGGEPTLYVDKRKRFQQMVEELKICLPDLQLALVTNGTFLPPGNWPNQFSWIRLSLDAATAQTYLKFRGKNFFQRVIQNYLTYLDFDIPYVGISFLFAKTNIHEYAKVASFIYNLVKSEKPKHLHKVNIQYRPLRHDPYEYYKPFTEAISEQQLQKAVKEVQDLAASNSSIRQFLKNQTNITAVLGGNSHPNLEFDRCYYSQTFRIIRANGDLRPCFIRVSEPDFNLGNLHSDSLESISLNTLLIASKQKPHCDAFGCRQCHVNHTFEKGLNGSLKPSNSPEVQKDRMF